MIRRLPVVLGMVFVLVALAGPAHAQSGDGLRPPVPSGTEEPPILRTYLVMLLLGAAVVGANAIPPRRGHQD